MKKETHLALGQLRKTLYSICSNLLEKDVASPESGMQTLKRMQVFADEVRAKTAWSKELMCEKRRNDPKNDVH